MADKEEIATQEDKKDKVAVPMVGQVQDHTAIQAPPLAVVAVQQLNCR